MKENEIIVGNDEICQALGFETNKVYCYKIPNTFPHDKEVDTGWTEFYTQQIGFETDWNMLIGAYNRIILLLNALPDAAKLLLKEDKNFLVNFSLKSFIGITDVNWQINISSSWQKLVMFCKWYNSVKLMQKDMPNRETEVAKRQRSVASKAKSGNRKTAK